MRIENVKMRVIKWERVWNDKREREREREREMEQRIIHVAIANWATNTAEENSQP